MNKNTGHFLAFNELWFKKNQRLLLWLLNAPVIKVWFRWVLRIRKTDCLLDTRITELGPNRFSFGDRYFKRKGQWFVERTTDFRTHPKYGKRLYYAFKPLWWAMHLWDFIADPFIPRLSFGFATLTQFPEADPATAATDGDVMRTAVNESFATIRSSAGSSATTAGLNLLVRLIASGTANQYATLRRAIMMFDTSSLGATATVSAATLSVFGNGTENGLNGASAPALHIAGATPGSNTALASTDYGQCQTTSFGNVAFASYSTVAYNGITLNASGLSNISKTGVSKFSAQLSWDILNSFTGTWSNSSSTTFQFASADTAGTTSDPKLVVTYSTVTHDPDFFSVLMG